jgi:hypothetical protein
MAYKNDKSNAYGDMGKKGYSQGDMSPSVKDFQKPESCYSQKYDQSPTMYMERQNSRQGHEAGKLKRENHKGRYDK